MWDSFASNFVDFLEGASCARFRAKIMHLTHQLQSHASTSATLVHPCPQCTDALVRHDALACVMRLQSLPAAAGSVCALIGTASKHHAAFLAPQALQLLQVHTPSNTTAFLY